MLVENAAMAKGFECLARVSTVVVRTCSPDARARMWGRVRGEGGEFTEVVA